MCDDCRVLAGITSAAGSKCLPHPETLRGRGDDIPAAARALGVALTEHSMVLARAKTAVAKIEAGMAWAQRTGVLHEFDQEYRRRRVEAQGRGERVTGYAQATTWLRRVLVETAASNSTAPLMSRVFEDATR